MRFNAKSCLITAVALIFVGIITSIIIGVAVWRGRVWRGTLTAETPATVTNVTFREVRGRRRGSSTRDETVVAYTYTVGGRTLTGA